MQIFSFSPFGYEGSLVNVEVDLRRGIPAIDIVGLADGTVKESRERMHAAIRNSGLEFPPERVLISLSPADLRKEGAGFDLAIALAVLKVQQEADDGTPIDYGYDSILVMGELELNGNVRPVKGIHAAVKTAFDAGIRMCIVPELNFEEAKEVLGMKVFGTDNLMNAFQALYKKELFVEKEENTELLKNQGIPKDAVNVEGVYFPAVTTETEYSSIVGQEQLIRGLQIAASGNHNLLVFGPPGCGKTLAVTKFSGLLPLLSLEEAQSVTRIYSIAGILNPAQPLIRTRPFRMPHQTATIEGICGGGVKCSPGEISLAHNGVLFLDEAAEFRSSVLQMLRVPLETKSITLSRAGRTTVFPASFQLLMSTNPCPCGNFGSKDKICLCSARSVELYWKKFSGPLLDRIDLRIKAEIPEEIDEMVKENRKSVSTEELRVKIARAYKKQINRQGKLNAYLEPFEIVKYCKLNDECTSILNDVTTKYSLSPRAVNSILKVSRTIADMEGMEFIDERCIAEASDFRKTQTGLDFSIND